MDDHEDADRFLTWIAAIVTGIVGSVFFVIAAFLFIGYSILQ